LFYDPSWHIKRRLRPLRKPRRLRVNTKVKFALTIASSLTIAVPVSAQVSPSPGKARAKSSDPMSEVICQKEDVVGSRLATRRVCMTRFQWQEQRLGDSQQTEKAQIPAAKNTPG
jgi:hypothetical protein